MQREEGIFEPQENSLTQVAEIFDLSETLKIHNLFGSLRGPHEENWQDTSENYC